LVSVIVNTAELSNFQAAWSGKTIQFIADNVGPSLAQRPNIVLIHAGTNDLNSNNVISTEGNDPAAAAKRLGLLIDKFIDACPDATILVAMIIGTWDPAQAHRTHQFDALVPGVVRQRRDAGKRVLAVDFTSFPNKLLRDGIHPTNEGYNVFGDYWYDFVTQIPVEWIQPPVGDDPDRF
jgi:lysophospholipase L1-like esterase